MPTNFEEALDEIALKVAPALMYQDKDSNELGRELFKKDVREAIDKYLIGEDDAPRNTSEHSKRNFLRLEQRRSLWGPKAKA